MDTKKKIPSRLELDEAFHHLQDQITRIAVLEEQEMILSEEGTDGKSQ